jgi:choline dehydrogenase-like flavoprotein
MAQRLKEVDVVVIGVGMVGTMVSKELAAAGYKVVGLERGQSRATVPEFQSPGIHDELRFDVRKALMQDNTREPVSFRKQASQVALPVRRWESFLPGTGLGGSMVHWNGQTYRFQANDFQLATRTRERYGKNFPDSDLTIQDWGARIGAHRDGRFVGGLHLVRSQTSRFDLMPYTGEETTSRTYGWPAFRGATTLVQLDTQTPGFMRAPMEMASFFALESAVDWPRSLAWIRWNYVS